jgi:hypothetical protein
MGALLNSRLRDRLEGIDGAPVDGRVDVLLDRADRGALPDALVDAMSRALSASLHEVFIIVCIMAAICVAVVSFFPRGGIEDLSSAKSASSKT